jgi:hypothetical protein
LNIFHLDNDPVKAAVMHNDKHVVKMILEAAQMLSTTHRMVDGTEVIGKSPTGRKQKQYILSDYVMNATLYKAVHYNHPSTVWTRQSKQNYQWHYDLFVALCDEYTHRYGKVHKTDEKLREALRNVPNNLPDTGLTRFAEAMPQECIDTKDPVQSYRNYYMQEKAGFAVWTKREKPQWFKEES